MQEAHGGRQETKAYGETYTGERNQGLGESSGVPSEGAQAPKGQQATDSIQDIHHCLTQWLVGAA